MKNLSKLLAFAVFSALYMSASLQSVYGDDTEIFFAPADDVDDVRPNIMFIIDSSGSMGWGVDGTSDTRMEVVQDVMDDVLTDISNVNVGLMRFNNGLGGGILYPVSNIDDPVTPIVFQTVSDGANDVVQKSLLGTVEMSGDSLRFNGANDIVGVRFEDLNIPQGATILSAIVSFTSDRDSSGAADLLITAEQVADSAIVTGTVGELSTRRDANFTPGTTEAKAWSITESWENDEIYSTPDISKIVEEVASLSGWCGGNSLMLFFQSASGATRNVYSDEGILNNPPANDDDPRTIFSPRIRVEYSQSFTPTANKCLTNEVVSQISVDKDDFEIRQNGSFSVNSSDLELYQDGSNVQQGIGLVFQNIKIPQGATVQYAYLSFTADEESDIADDGDSNLNISIVNRDNVTPPTSNPFDYGVLNSYSTIGPLPWLIDEDWSVGSTYNTPDISSLISPIVNKASWALNNNIALFLRGSSGDHTADSYQGTAPKLHIGYRGTWVSGINTIRDDIKAAVQGLTPSGGTPVSSTYAEAGKYFKGDDVLYGATRNNYRYRRVSHPLSYTGGVVSRSPSCTEANLDSSNCQSEVILGAPKYQSPATDSCQSNHIVYLTDGSANSHRSTTNSIYSSWSNGGSCAYNSTGNDCSIKMAAWLNTNDISPSLAGKQTINTHMIGFGPGADPSLMSAMAAAGGGGYYSPSDRASLVTDISNIVNSIANVNTTFVTSGVTVNQFNRLTHNDELYFSLFTPKSAKVWPGNIKRYRLLGGDIVDITAVDAIEPLTSEFKDTSKSFWSDVVDGNDVSIGGVAGELTKNRNVYSFISGNDLTATANAVSTTNSSITEAMLGGVTSQRRNTILNWAVGVDVNDPAYDPNDLASVSSTPARKDIGDGLHSQPTVIQYNDSGGNLLTTRVYVGTSHGYLHSFDADNGSEKWSFIPEDQLSRLDDIIKQTAGDHAYGLDGSPSIHIDDVNKNGAADPGEKVRLYIGQRRGGRNYYALDITVPDSPKMLFDIEGGTGRFTMLGQTWSTPSIVKMNLPGVNTEKLVMVFGGGYDTSQDNAGTGTTTDLVGNIVYIVDAITGDLLWNSVSDTAAHGGTAGPVSSMNGVASRVTAFDLDGDSLIDHLYVTDSKAQVFRFDVNNDDGTIKGGRIAHLNEGGSSEATNRRFYYRADNALIRTTNESFISVSIGSGYRAHPLNDKITDHFYVLKDKGVLAGVFDMDAELSDLEDVTSLTDSDTDGVSDAVARLNDDSLNKKGWYIQFDATGEKVIDKSITFNNSVFFTSYIPPGSIGNVCQAAAGGGRLYSLNIVNGNPYVDTNNDGSLDETDRYSELVSSGIAPTPQIIVENTADGPKPKLCVGKECDFQELPDAGPGLKGIRWWKN